MKVSDQIARAATELRKAVNRLTFSEPVTHVYNPLDYAWEAYRIYLEKFANSTKRIVFLGMNPGPWGMAQVGIPFGEISSVRNWMKIEAPIGKPKHENPKRPIEGFACTRSEVSGRRLWGLMAERFGEAELGTILHPSPASPAANRGWAQAATKQMNEQGVWE